MEQKQLNIAIVAPFIFYPLNDGGRVSQYAMLDYLQHVHAITLIFTASSSDCYKRIDEVKRLLPKVEVEIIHNLSEKSKQPFLLKLLEHLQFRLQNSWFGSKQHAPVGELDSKYLTTVGEAKNRQYIDQFTAIIRKKKFHIVQVDMHPYIDLVYCIPAGIQKLFVQHEIRFTRLETYLAANHIRAGRYEDYILRYVKRTELHLLQQYDAVVTFSEDDRQKLLPALAPEKTMVSPFPVQESHFTVIPEGDYKANKLVFLGGSDHTPNKDAVAWFLNEAMELITKQYNLPLHIIGKWPQAERERLNASQPTVVFAGYVEDLLQYCKDSIMVVPIFVGSGIRTKILYAMAQGVPVVSTATGCEGIEVVDGESFLKADTAEEFAARIGYLLEQPAAAAAMIRKAQAVMRSTYSQEAAGKRRSDLYLQLTAQAAVAAD